MPKPAASFDEIRALAASLPDRRAAVIGPIDHPRLVLFAASHGIAVDVPGCSHGAMADTVQAMAEDKSIIGMKYSSYDMPDFIRTVKHCGDKIAILSGEEPLFATHIALGAQGGVLASATIYPKIWLEIFALAKQGKLKEALKLQDRIDPVVDSIYTETNPGPLKKYMEMVGMPVGGVRLPLLGPLPETVASMKKAAEFAKSVNLA